MIRSASTTSTTPPRLQRTTAPLSRATVPSRPVPTIGASERTSGTAWRCMFEPIRARFASSCSRNGMSEAATDTICIGDTSMYSTSAGPFSVNSFSNRQEIRSSLRRPSSSRVAFAWAMT